jgi:hypothetical protein
MKVDTRALDWDVFDAYKYLGCGLDLRWRPKKSMIRRRASRADGS